jgi:hypothetical protein
MGRLTMRPRLTIERSLTMWKPVTEVTTRIGETFMQRLPLEFVITNGSWAFEPVHLHHRMMCGTVLAEHDGQVLVKFNLSTETYVRYRS